MKAYKINEKGKVNRINHVNFNKEKTDLQKIVEDNLETIFNLKLVKSEFSIKNRQIDTLAFDDETKSFVIIEYKIKKNSSLIDQGLAYLEKLLNNFADFKMIYYETMGKIPKKGDIDKSQSRIMFVSPYFTDLQLEATSFKDLPFELWKSTKFENNMILFEQLEVSRNKESINPLLKSQTGKIKPEIEKDIKVYNEEDHTTNKNENIVNLYEELRDRILSEFEEIKIVPQKHYIAFKYDNKNVISVEIQQSKLKIFVGMKKGTLKSNDKKLVINTKGHYGTGDYQYNLKPDDDLFEFLSIFKKSYDDKVKS